MSCEYLPYEGHKPYIFFSYAHANQEIADHLIQHLFEDGYRVWYDEGIHPGEDWPEVIASHLERCSVCIALITKESSESHNCRNEINFVLEERKKLLPIIWTDFAMSPGMKLQLGGTQYIKRYEISSDTYFYQRLYQSEDLIPCRGEELIRRNKAVSQPESKSEPKPEPKPEPKFEPVRQQKLPVFQKGFLLINVANGYVYPVDKTIVFGRSSVAGIRIDDKRISKNHARFECGRDGICYLVDTNSTNGVFLNGKRITENTLVPLKSKTWIGIADHMFLFVDPTDSSSKIENEFIDYLQCLETGECLLLDQPEILLGRKQAWPGGTMSDTRISRVHMILKEQSYGWLFETQETRNGTYLNEQPLDPGDSGVIGDGDEIRLGSYFHFRFHHIKIQKRG